MKPSLLGSEEQVEALAELLARRPDVADIGWPAYIQHLGA